MWPTARCGKGAERRDAGGELSAAGQCARSSGLHYCSGDPLFTAYARPPGDARRQGLTGARKQAAVSQSKQNHERRDRKRFALQEEREVSWLGRGTAQSQRAFRNALVSEDRQCRRPIGCPPYQRDSCSAPCQHWQLAPDTTVSERTLPARATDHICPRLPTSAMLRHITSPVQYICSRPERGDAGPLRTSAQTTLPKANAG